MNESPALTGRAFFWPTCYLTKLKPDVKKMWTTHKCGQIQEMLSTGSFHKTTKKASVYNPIQSYPQMENFYVVPRSFVSRCIGRCTLLRVA